MRVLYPTASLHIVLGRDADVESSFVQGSDDLIAQMEAVQGANMDHYTASGVGSQNAQGIASSQGATAVSGAIDDNQLTAAIQDKVDEINALMAKLDSCSADVQALVTDDTGAVAETQTSLEQGLQLFTDQYDALVSLGAGTGEDSDVAFMNAVAIGMSLDRYSRSQFEKFFSTQAVALDQEMMDANLDLASYGFSTTAIGSADASQSSLYCTKLSEGAATDAMIAANNAKCGAADCDCPIVAPTSA